MLYEEEQFRKQAVEPHHIYWVQRDLLKNTGMKEPAEVNKFSPCGTELSRADVELAPIGWDHWQNGGGRSDYRENILAFESMGDVRDTSILSSLDIPACSRDNQNSPNSVLSMHSIANSSIMHASYGSTTSPQNKILCTGLKHCHDNLHLNDLKKNTKSTERGELDLNKYPCEESFLHCNEIGIGANFNQTSSYVQETSTYTEFEGKSNGQSDHGSKAYHTDIESVFGLSPGIHRNLDSHYRNHDFVDMPTPSSETCRVMVTQKSSSNNVSDTVRISNVSCQEVSEENTGSNMGMLCKTNYATKKFSGTNTVQVGNDLDLSKVYSEGMFHNDESTSCTKSSLEQDSKPSSVNDVKAQCSEQQMDEEPHEIDSSVQRREISLSCSELNGSSKDQDVVGATNKSANVKKERPQYSSDSFESIVLKLPESNVDDYCVTSKRYEVDDASTRGCGIQLRRGRRIKDFRKDVLPHLPSLSSKEIWEDMKIMQDALRSRNFKRPRSKVQNVESGSCHLKSRRTRCNRVAQRHKT